MKNHYILYLLGFIILLSCADNNSSEEKASSSLKLEEKNIIAVKGQCKF